MPPTVLPTSLDTLNIEQAQRVVAMDETIHELDPQATSLTALLMKLRKESTFSPKFEWLQDEYAPKEDAINNGAGYDDTVVAWTVDNGSYFRPYDILLILRTGEVALIISIATNVLTVATRPWGQTAAAALVDDDPVWIIGNALREGDNAPDMRTTKIVPKFNFTQIFREPVQVTRTENDSKLYGGKDLARLRRKHGVEHMMQLERALWFGERQEDNSGATPRRSTDGVIPILTYGTSDTYIQDEAASALTEAELDTFMENAFRYGSSTKFAFCSRAGLSRINTLAKTGGNIQMFPEDQIYGIAIFTYINPHGTLKLIVNNLFTGAETDGRFGKWIVVLDIPDISYVFFNNADTKLLLNRQANDVDGEMDEYLTEAGLKLIHDRHHAILKDFT